MTAPVERPYAVQKTRALLYVRYVKRGIQIAQLRAENTRLRQALEKISDPTKRDHQEPDVYTTLMCVMSIAHEALESEKGEKK